MREFCGNLRAFCGQNGYGFSAPHNFGMPLHVLTNLRASFSRLPLQTFVYSVKGREHWNSVFLGVLGVSGFCGKKCYDFPNIQSKAETTFFFQEDEGPGTEKEYPSSNLSTGGPRWSEFVSLPMSSVSDLTVTFWVWTSSVVNERFDDFCGQSTQEVSSWTYFVDLDQFSGIHKVPGLFWPIHPSGLGDGRACKNK